MGKAALPDTMQPEYVSGYYVLTAMLKVTLAQM